MMKKTNVCDKYVGVATIKKGSRVIKSTRNKKDESTSINATLRCEIKRLQRLNNDLEIMGLTPVHNMKEIRDNSLAIMEIAKLLN